MSGLTILSRPRQRAPFFPPTTLAIVQAAAYVDDRATLSRFYSPGATLLQQVYAGVFNNTITYIGGANDETAYTEERFFMPRPGTVTVRILREDVSVSGSYRIYLNDDIVLNSGDTTGVFLRDFHMHTFAVGDGLGNVRVTKIGGTRIAVDAIFYEPVEATPLLPSPLVVAPSGNDLLWPVVAVAASSSVTQTPQGEMVLTHLNNTNQFKYSNRQALLSPNTQYLHRFRVKVSRSGGPAHLVSLTVSGANAGFADLGYLRRYNAAQAYRTISTRFTTAANYVTDDWFPPSNINNDYPGGPRQKDGLPEFNFNGLAPLEMTLDRYGHQLVLFDATVHHLPAQDDLWDIEPFNNPSVFWTPFTASSYTQYGGVTGFGVTTLPLKYLAVDCFLDFYTATAADLRTATITVNGGAGPVVLQQQAAVTTDPNINGAPTASIRIPACPVGSGITRTVTVTADTANGVHFHSFHLRTA